MIGDPTMAAVENSEHRVQAVPHRAREYLHLTVVLPGNGIEAVTTAARPGRLSLVRRQMGAV